MQDIKLKVNEIKKAPFKNDAFSFNQTKLIEPINLF